MSPPPEVGLSQLFLDDEMIEQAVRLQRVIHQPVKCYGNPIYTVGAPWEGTGIVYLGGVHVDPQDRLWKAWYVTYVPPACPEIRFAVCMIVSSDGIHWERPELDVHRMQNGARTNIVLDLGEAGRTAAPTIMYEPENVPEPWTMFISLCWPADSMHYKGYFLRSTDGVHWRWLNERPNGVIHGMHDRTTAFRGPDPEFPYIMLGRGKEDIHRWKLPRVAHAQATNLNRVQHEEPIRAVFPDLEDDPATQVYHAYGFPYESTYVGMFQHFEERSDPCGEMELITSRDGMHWSRLRPRRIFLPRSQNDESFDSRITDTALSPPVRTYGRHLGGAGMDTLWFYYWGGQAMHGNRHLSWGRGLGLAQLRADGFCSLRAERFRGTLVTKPFVWTGQRLIINACCLGGSGEGSLRTEVLGANFEPLAGFSLEDADAVANDGTRLVQTWKSDGLGIANLAGNRVRLRFVMENYDLFSFRAAETQ